MWTVVKVQGTDVLRGVLDQWKAGVDAHEPQKVASVFTKDAIFQGLPIQRARSGVATRCPALQDDLAGGGSAGDECVSFVDVRHSRVAVQ